MKSAMNCKTSAMLAVAFIGSVLISDNGLGVTAHETGNKVSGKHDLNRICGYYWCLI